MVAEVGRYAQKLDLIIEQGSTFAVTLTWSDENGTAIDNTGYTAAMDFRDTVDAASTLDSLTSAGGDITLGGATGEITITIAAAATAAYTWTDAVYDLEMTSSGGVVKRLIYGNVRVIPEVTR